LFIVTLSLNNFGFRDKRPYHYMYFWFSLRVYEVYFCTSENRFYRWKRDTRI